MVTPHGAHTDRHEDSEVLNRIAALLSGQVWAPEVWAPDVDLELIADWIRATGRPILGPEEVCGECSGTGLFALDPNMAVERCDHCMVFEGDLDAALALAKTRGLGELVCYSIDADDPDDSVRAFAGSYDDATLIAYGTSPWLQVVEPGARLRSRGA